MAITVVQEGSYADAIQQGYMLQFITSMMSMQERAKVREAENKRRDMVAKAMGRERFERLQLDIKKANDVRDYQDSMVNVAEGQLERSKDLLKLNRMNSALNALRGDLSSRWDELGEGKTESLETAMIRNKVSDLTRFLSGESQESIDMNPSAIKPRTKPFKTDLDDVLRFGEGITRMGGDFKSAASVMQSLLTGERPDLSMLMPKPRDVKKLSIAQLTSLYNAEAIGPDTFQKGVRDKLEAATPEFSNYQWVDVNPGSNTHGYDKVGVVPITEAEWKAMRDVRDFTEEEKRINDAIFKKGREEKEGKKKFDRRGNLITDFEAAQ